MARLLPRPDEPDDGDFVPELEEFAPPARPVTDEDRRRARERMGWPVGAGPEPEWFRGREGPPRWLQGGPPPPDVRPPDDWNRRMEAARAAGDEDAMAALCDEVEARHRRWRGEAPTLGVVE